MKILNIYNKIITEGVDMMSNLETNGSMVTLYHYSDEFFTTISTGKQSTRTPSSARGASQIWLYCHKDGNGKDSTVPRNYLYIVEIPLNEIYDMHNDPDNLSGDNRFQTVSNVKAAGYTAMYSTILNGEIPIANSFKPLKPTNVFKMGPNGYEEIDLDVERKKDILVGVYNPNGNSSLKVYADVSKEPSENSFYYQDYFKEKHLMTRDMIRQSEAKSSGDEYGSLFMAIKYGRA